MSQQPRAASGGFSFAGAVPPPYAPRDQVPISGPAVPPPPLPPPNTGMEFSETSAVTLTWQLNNLGQLYSGSVGEAKSKCIKSAIFGDADNLWEVLFYCNSGIQGGEYASLYLSCVPTQQERDSSIGTKWARRGLWWFRFEIRSSVPDERGKPIVFATKDASDHTFAVKTANWGWQQFAKRDTLFKHPLAAATDSFVISCTIQAQPQPPAGYWLGLGIPPSLDVRANVDQPMPTSMRTEGGPSTRHLGSGGGLSAWSGGAGASGGVAGGTTAGGGVKRVVPRELVMGIGSMLDDELYSDIEFIVPPARSHRHPSSKRSTSPRKIYANKKLLGRIDYFRAMFDGGFASSAHDGSFETDDGNLFDQDEFDASEAGRGGGDDSMIDELDDFSDSDAEDEAAEYTIEYEDAEAGARVSGEAGAGGKDGRRKSSIGPDTTDPTSAGPSAPAGRTAHGATAGAKDGDGESTSSEDEYDSTSSQASEGTSVGKRDAPDGSMSEDDGVDGQEADRVKNAQGEDEDGAPGSGKSASGSLFTPKARGLTLGHADERARGSGSGKKDTKGKAGMSRNSGPALGPKKTKVVIRDAAWSTWWALLYWIYTDIIYFAPLTSTFTHPPGASGGSATSSGPPLSGGGGGGGALGLSGSGTGAGSAAGPSGPRQSTSSAYSYASRAEWINAWLSDHGSQPEFSSTAGTAAAASSGVASHVLPIAFNDTAYGPCPRPVSAKAIYRLADKIDIPALKLRAFQHIMSQMTAANVPAEVFSRFSSTFEDVRKVQISFFLKHWGEIKKSDTMMQIWQQIRHGKHVGFEEVWPLIVGQLDFRPS